MAVLTKIVSEEIVNSKIILFKNVLLSTETGKLENGTNL